MKTPLIQRPQTEEEAKRLTPDNFPRTDNPLELAAQEKTRMMNEKTVVPASEERTSLFTPKVATILAVVGFALTGLATLAGTLPVVIPATAVLGASILGGLLSYVGGKALPGLLEGVPLIPVGLVPVCIMAAQGLTMFAAGLPQGGVGQGLCMLGSNVLMFLAGKVGPMAKTAPVPVTE